MKGILLEKVGGDYALVDTLTKPTPGKNQVLVKSLVTAFNPVEPFMQGTGMLITEFPIVLGADASGVVVEVGEGVTKFKKGDAIFGCTVLGVPGFAPFQEYHLMDEHLSFKKAKNLSTEEAATIGVGLLTAGLGVIVGNNIELEQKPVTDDSPWIVILGAAGSVGQFGIQLAKLSGYKVLAACSPANNSLVKSIGADAAFSYKLTVPEQVAEIQKITGGNFARVFDASAMAAETGLTALDQNKISGRKYFSTVNDWSPIDPRDGVEVYLVKLGEIGRSGNAETKQYNKDLAELIVKTEPLLEAGALKPLEWVKLGDVGVGEILKGIEAFASHKSGKKLIVRVAEE